MLAVILGAFGAHGLQKLTTDPKILHGFETAVDYQLYHAFALLLLAALNGQLDSRWSKRAANCFIIGIILFSGSLYMLTWLKIQESGGVRFVGPVTPIGGLFFIVGWLLLFISAFGRRRKVQS
jgi:uncharacterized membrane protein YgdD (TMEM256/DUF423 family)